MKLSDYVVEFVEKYVDDIFLLSGGGVMHMVDSIGRAKKLKAYCCHHEQAAATAAESYARMEKYNLGVACVTSGPGGTNAITGVGGAWLDSIPMMVISGQVKTPDIVPRKNGKPLFRQLGVQELNIVDMVSLITKYAVTVMDKREIRYHLEKAVYLARSGRPGPVWVDIPLDIQASDVNPDTLRGFIPPVPEKYDIPIGSVVSALRKAKRPLLMAGNGIRLAGGEKILWKVLEKLKINTVTPMIPADDLVTYDYPYYLGRQGIPGNYEANYAIDNCDLLLIIGERMSIISTSYEYDNFATQAKVIMVDIDKEELKKKMLRVDIPIQCDAKEFLEKLYRESFALNRWNIPVARFDPSKYQGDLKYVNIYRVMKKLSEYKTPYHTVTSDGEAARIPHQALRVVRGQRFITNAGMGQMGYGLPAAIGVCVASGKKPVLCMEGDGSLMLNIHELSTIVYHKLPIKLFIFNNQGYASIRNTHRNYFQKVFAADASSGVGLPNYSKLIPAWGLVYEKIENDKELKKLDRVMKYSGPIVIELMMDPNQPGFGKWSAGMYRGKPLSNS